MSSVSNYLAVAIGSAFGGVTRYFLSVSVLSRIAQPFPLATFIINVSGSFILGLFLTLTLEKFNVSEPLRLAVAVGFLGAYTTFSTFEYETFSLIKTNYTMTAFLYILLSVTLGFAGVWSGIFIARKI